MLRRVTAQTIPARGKMGLDAETLSVAGGILVEVQNDGEAAVRRYAEKFGELEAGAPLVVEASELRTALQRLAKEDRAVLERVAQRIEHFAKAQRETLVDLDTSIEGGRAGHSWSPMERAGCYAPGGRFPLPSSVLMTAVTARVAGVESVVVASPRANDVTKAAAAVAGADALIPIGGAHAIGALAYGAGPIERVDVIVGPGSRWVTAAKKLVSGEVAIDMIAGPSELVVLADASASAKVVAADLLGQAEHDDDAIPILVTPSTELADSVDAELARQLETLPTAPTARNAIENGYIVLVASVDEGAAVCDQLAPEHLQVMTEDADEVCSWEEMVRVESIGAVNQKLATVPKSLSDLSLTNDCPDVEQLGDKHGR
ncbi:MAG: histidinol dehydrogenase [Myxococcota bacterium]